MKIGLGIGIPFIRNYISSIFNPSKLFTTGVNGAWYDPSDINLTWRRNLLTYSEQFDNASWLKGNVVVTSNASAAPDGALTADMLLENTVTNQHTINSSTVVLSAGAVYVTSMYVKPYGVQYILLGLDGGTYSSVTFDVINGAFVRTTSVGPNQYIANSATIQSVGNGWFRVSAAFTAYQANQNVVVKLNRLNKIGQDPSYTGDGTSGIYIWGAQLEVGNIATPYQRITDGIQDYLDYKPLPILYQDAAGTTPVTAVGQPVGLMLDKSKGLVLGSELVTNGDFSNGGTGWVLSGFEISGGTLNVVAPGFASTTYNGFINGKSYVVTYTITAATVTNDGVSLRLGTAAGVVRNSPGTYREILVSNGTSDIFVVTRGGGTWRGSIDNISVRELPGNHAFNSSGNSANFPVLQARYNRLIKSANFSDAAWSKVLGATTPDANTIVLTGTNGSRVEQSTSDLALAGVGWTASVVLSGSGTVGLNVGASDGAGGQNEIIITLSATPTRYALTHTFLSGVTASSYVRLMVIHRDGMTATTVTATDADLRVANDALNQPAYQRVNTATDYDTVGFKPYLAFNGVNQWLQTNSIDFTYGDKMFVCAGVRKLSDAARGVLVELSSVYANPGTFALTAPDAAAANYGTHLNGNGAWTDTIASGYSAPITNVVSSLYDIAASVNLESLLRVNGVAVGTNTGSANTGNLGNYPLYIGARAGTSLWFNGRLYGLVVAGKQASTDEITSCEQYLNQKTGAY